MEIDLSYLFVAGFCLVCILFAIGSNFIKSKKVCNVIGVALVVIGVTALAVHFLFLRT